MRERTIEEACKLVSCEPHDEESARSHSRSLCVLAVSKEACKLVSCEPHDEESARSHSRSFPTLVTTRFGQFRLSLSHMAEIITIGARLYRPPFLKKARSITPFAGPALSGIHFSPP